MTSELTLEEENRCLRMAESVFDDLAYLPKEARRALTAEIQNTPSGADHALRGMTAPSPAQLIGELWVTKSGQLVREVLAEGEAAQNDTGESERDRRIRAANAEPNLARRLSMAHELDADIAANRC